MSETIDHGPLIGATLDGYEICVYHSLFSKAWVENKDIDLQSMKSALKRISQCDNVEEAIGIANATIRTLSKSFKD